MRLMTKGLAIAIAALFAAATPAQKGDAKDDFKRERRPGKAAAKDALEGKAAPALQVAQWMNTKDKKSLDLAKLHGKVVLLKFWGVW